MNKITISILAGLFLAATPVAAGAATYERKPQVVDNPDYPTTDVKVVEMNILDYSADANKGNTNVTTIIQQMLNALGDASLYPSGERQAYRKTGGTLYLPAGTYNVVGNCENTPEGSLDELSCVDFDLRIEKNNNGYKLSYTNVKTGKTGSLGCVIILLAD